MPDPNPSERLAEIEARVEEARDLAVESGKWIGGPSALVEHLDPLADEDIPWLLEQLREAWDDLELWIGDYLKLKHENARLREFFDAWTARENETTDFDLHAATVERFRKAHDALADSGEASGEAG